MPLRSDLDIRELDMAVRSYDATEAPCVELVLKLPEGVALKILACIGLIGGRIRLNRQKRRGAGTEEFPYL